MPYLLIDPVRVQLMPTQQDRYFGITIISQMWHLYVRDSSQIFGNAKYAADNISRVTTLDRKDVVYNVRRRNSPRYLFPEHPGHE